MFTATPPGTALIAASCRLFSHCSVWSKPPLALNTFLLLTLFLPPHWWISLECKVGFSAATLQCPVAVTAAGVTGTQVLAEFSTLVSLLCTSGIRFRFAVLPSHLSSWCSSVRGPDSAGHLQQSSGCKGTAYWSMVAKISQVFTEQ